jgi:hypothetical protein
VPNQSLTPAPRRRIRRPGRCRAGENLHEKRGDQNMGERLAVTPQRRREPQEAEGARVHACAAQMAHDQDEEGFDFLEKLVKRQLASPPGDGIDDAKEILARLPGQDPVSACPDAHDRRNRSPREPGRRRIFDDASLEPDRFRAPDDVLRAGGEPLERQFVRKMPPIGRDAIEPAIPTRASSPLSTPRSESARAAE